MENLSYMEQNERVKTEAHRIYSFRDISPNVRFMALVFQSFRALHNSDTVPRKKGIPQKFDLRNEVLKNPELHACIDYSRKMLHETQGLNVVQPYTESQLSDKSRISPIDQLKSLSAFPELDCMTEFSVLSQYYRQLLQNHEIKLLQKENTPSVTASSSQDRNDALQDEIDALYKEADHPYVLHNRM